MSSINFCFPMRAIAGKKVREICALPNELARLGTTDQTGLLRFDVAYLCRCFMEGDARNVEEIVFEIEMQIGNERGFVKRLFHIGSELRRATNDRHVIVLGFMKNKQRDAEEPPSTSARQMNESDGAVVSAVDELADTHCIDLCKMALLLQEGARITIHGQELEMAGLEWLRLPCVRYWQPQCFKRFPVPRGSASDPAVNSAIKILEFLTEDELDSYINQERSWENMLEAGEERGIDEGIRTTTAELLAAGFTEARIARAIQRLKNRLRCAQPFI